MPVNAYHTPEMMTVLRAYAASLEPTPRPEYKVLHHWNSWIQVPRGYLPIRVAQFSRGPRDAEGDDLYHWAIFIPTSARRGVGNYYQLCGSLQDGYFVQYVLNKRHSKWDSDERGSHLVGYVAPSFLATLEMHFATIPVQQGKPGWNCQTWVVEALKGLNHTHMHAVQMDYTQWVRQMEIVEEAWEVGDA